MRQCALVDDRAGRCVLDTEHVELADFFFERHLLQQGFYPLLGIGLRGRRADTEHHAKQRQSLKKLHGRSLLSAVEATPIAVESEWKGWY